MFFNIRYEQVIYNTGIFGLGDAIARIIVKLEIYNDKDYFAALFYFIINFLLFVFIAYPKLDKFFNIGTIFAIIFLPFFVAFFNWIDLFQFITFQFLSFEKELFNDIFRSILAGILLALCLITPLKIGASTGGIDIIAKYLYVYKNININFMITCFNYAIIILFMFINFLLKNQEGLDLISFVLSNLKMISFCLTTSLFRLHHNQKIKKFL